MLYQYPSICNITGLWLNHTTYRNNGDTFRKIMFSAGQRHSVIPVSSSLHSEICGEKTLSHQNTGFCLTQLHKLFELGRVFQLYSNVKISANCVDSNELSAAKLLNSHFIWCKSIYWGLKPVEKSGPFSYLPLLPQYFKQYTGFYYREANDYKHL